MVIAAALRDAEVRRLRAVLIFDLEDRYLRARGTRGSPPRPLGAVTFSLVSQIVGNAYQDLPQPLQLIVVRNPSGYHLFFGVATQSDGSRITLPPSMFDQTTAPQQPYVVRIQSAYYQSRDLVLSHDPNLVLPNDPKLIPPPGRNAVLPDAQDASVPACVFSGALDPGYAYPFPSESTLPGGGGPTLLRGNVCRVDGAGIAQAKVEVTQPPVTPSPIYWTDETGQWVLPFPDSQPSGAVAIQLTVPPDPSQGIATSQIMRVPNVPIVQGSISSLRQTALRGSVVNVNKNDAGLANVTVTPSARVGGRAASVTTADDGSWVYYYGLDQKAQTVTVTATLPDGKTKQRQTGVQVQPQQTVIVPTMKFT